MARINCNHCQKLFTLRPGLAAVICPFCRTRHESGVGGQESGVRSQETGIKSQNCEDLTPDSCLLTPGNADDEMSSILARLSELSEQLEKAKAAEEELPTSAMASADTLRTEEEKGRKGEREKGREREPMDSPSPPLPFSPSPRRPSRHEQNSRPWGIATWASVSASVALGLVSAVVGVTRYLDRPEMVAPSSFYGQVEEQEPGARSQGPAIKGQKGESPTSGRSSAFAEQTQEFVERLNRHRKRAGLGPVALDAGLSRGCLAHAKYLAKNTIAGSSTRATIDHEDADRPGYSLDGQTAAGVALIAYTEPMHAVDPWLASLFSRVALLAPELQRIGIGCARHCSGDWICVVNAAHGREDEHAVYPASQGNPTGAVIYPTPSQDEVPRLAVDRLDDVQAENVGFPISVTFPKQTTLRGVQATLTDEAGKSVGVCVSAPTHPLKASLQRATIGIYPLQPLEANRRYHVEVSAMVNGALWRQRWRFTTGK